PAVRVLAGRGESPGGGPWTVLTRPGPAAGRRGIRDPSRSHAGGSAAEAPPGGTSRRLPRRKRRVGSPGDPRRRRAQDSIDGSLPVLGGPLHLSRPSLPFLLGRTTTGRSARSRRVRRPASC